MKKKTRNLIGKILVYSGLIIIFMTNLAIHGLKGYFLPNHVMTFNFNLDFWIINISIVVLLIGGFWGMKRK